MRIKKLLGSREIELSRAHDIACERTNERRHTLLLGHRSRGLAVPNLRKQSNTGRQRPCTDTHTAHHDTQSHNATIPTRSVVVTETV